MTYSTNEVNFLDTTIYIDKHTKSLKSKLYKKPTDVNSLLDYNSYHPNHTKTNMIYTQALRYRLAITDNKIFKMELKNLKNILLHRNYPIRLINKTFQKLKKITQNDCLFNKIKQRPYHNNNKNKQPLPFIVEYYENIRPLKNILTKHWYLIKGDNELTQIFPNEPNIVYKKHKNIKDTLIRTRFTGD